MCGILGCGVDTVFTTITNIILAVPELFSGIFVTFYNLLQIMYWFFNIIAITIYIILNPSLLIMIILTVGNFYAAIGGTRKEVVYRYGHYYRIVPNAIYQFFIKLIEIVMWLIGAIIDII